MMTAALTDDQLAELYLDLAAEHAEHERDVQAARTLRDKRAPKLTFTDVRFLAEHVGRTVEAIDATTGTLVEGTLTTSTPAADRPFMTACTFAHLTEPVLAFTHGFARTTH